MRRLVPLIGSTLVVGGVALALVAPWSATGAASKAPVKLHGVMHVGSFTLKRGTTYVVTKSVMIVASGKVEIDGPIELAPGASFRILAKGPIVNRAAIGALPAGKAGGRVLDAVADGAQCPFNPTIEEYAGLNTVTIAAPIVAPNGGTFDGEGCSGTSIFLSGTAVSVAAQLHAGNGGPGSMLPRYPVDGRPGPCHTGGNYPATAIARAGNGGHGGSVFININLYSEDKFSADSFHGNPRGIRAGRGGDGGSIGSSVSPFTGPDGGPGQSGASVQAASGAGGGGGDARLYSVKQGDFKPVSILREHFGAGLGGSSGSIFVAAGNGGLPNCDGGATTALVGYPGRTPFGPETAPLPRVAIYHGNGNPGPAQSQADPNGSHGGNVVVSGHSQYSFDPLGPADVKTVTVADAGNAGEGFNGCPVPTGR